MHPPPKNLLIDDSRSRVRVITLNRPHRLNALDGDTLSELLQSIQECHIEDRDIRVIVLRGAGRAFCTGNDLKWLAEGVLHDTSAHIRHQDKMQEIFGLLESARQVVIASIHGHAVAGGFELALAADIMVAANDAVMGDAHLRRNFLPSGGSSQRLPRKLGLPRALFYLLTGRTMSGLEAERSGLAALSVSSQELEHATMELASEIAQADAHALAAMKHMARRALDLPLEDGLALERWSQIKYRNESPSLHASVHAFAAGDHKKPME